MKIFLQKYYIGLLSEQVAMEADTHVPVVSLFERKMALYSD